MTGPAHDADKAGPLDAADAYLSLSCRENFNFTSAEALAPGLALVLSPGNLLSPDLTALPAAKRLYDDVPATAAQRPQALTQVALLRADCAVLHLLPDILARQLRAATDRHARPSIPAPVGQSQEQKS